LGTRSFSCGHKSRLESVQKEAFNAQILCGLLCRGYAALEEATAYKWQEGRGYMRRMLEKHGIQPHEIVPALDRAKLEWITWRTAG